MPNILGQLPDARAKEIFETILDSGSVKIERIVSLGQATPGGQWLEDPRHEWVLLLEGASELSFADGRRLSLRAGDHLNIPAGTRHRVDWTDPKQPSVWLAVYYGE